MTARSKPALGERQIASHVALVGNPRAESRTHAAALEVRRQLMRLSGPDSSPGFVDLAEAGPELLRFGDPDVARSVAAIRSARVLVVASPTYKATYTGLLKLFLDQVPTGGLAGVEAVPMMVGAGGRHALAVEVHLRPLLIELGARCPFSGLYVPEDEFPHLEAVVARWLAR